MHLRDVKAAGLDRSAVKRRVAAELMHPMFHRVWAWGHRAVTREAWFLGATLSVGECALLDGVSACQLYGVYERRHGLIQIVAPNHARDQARLRVRRADPLPRRCLRDGVPVVPIEEALLGLSGSCASDRDVRRAIRAAQVKRLATFERLRRHAAASAGRPGIRRFRRLLGDRAAATKSELEDAAVDLLRRYGFQPPRINEKVLGEEADLYLGGLVIELDSEEFHDNSVQASDDTRKHVVWEAGGLRVERLTWDDVHVRPVATVRRLRAGQRDPGPTGA